MGETTPGGGDAGRIHPYLVLRKIRKTISTTIRITTALNQVDARRLQDREPSSSLSCYRKKLFGWSIHLSYIMNQELSHFNVMFTLPVSSKTSV